MCVYLVHVTYFFARASNFTRRRYPEAVLWRGLAYHFGSSNQW